MWVDEMDEQLVVVSVVGMDVYWVVVSVVLMDEHLVDVLVVWKDVMLVVRKADQMDDLMVALMVSV